MTPEPMSRMGCTFYVHGFGLQELPLLHELGAVPQLLAGQISEVLLADGVPAELIDTLKGHAPVDVARFFVMWINAGFDFEAASWSMFLAGHRALFPQDEEPAPGEAAGDGDVTFGEGLAAASALDSYAEHVADQILENFRTLH